MIIMELANIDDRLTTMPKIARKPHHKCMKVNTSHEDKVMLPPKAVGSLVADYDYIRLMWSEAVSN